MAAESASSWMVPFGADGVHSVVRTGLFGGDRPRFLGTMAWRSVIPMERLPREMTRSVAAAWLGPKGHGRPGRANDAAMAILTRIVEQAREWGVPQVISYRHQGNGKPRPVKNPGGAFRRVLRDLGLKGHYTFHSTKSSFVTAVAHKASGPVVQALARHRDFDTTRRYLLVADAAKRAAVDAIADRTATHGLDLLQEFG